MFIGAAVEDILLDLFPLHHFISPSIEELSISVLLWNVYVDLSNVLLQAGVNLDQLLIIPLDLNLVFYVLYLHRWKVQTCILSGTFYIASSPEDINLLHRLELSLHHRIGALHVKFIFNGLLLLLKLIRCIQKGNLGICRGCRNSQRMSNFIQ